MDEQKKEVLWCLQKPICVELSNEEMVVIPIGFVTDFASVPKFLWSFIGPVGHYNMASVIHDYFYTYKNKSRKFADYEFLNWMNFQSPNRKIRNKLMYWGVRLFGAKRYKENFLS